MDWLNKMNLSLNYIEQHLTEEISNTELASIVCCSPYHFTRMFSFISGITLSEYIRRRRLTMATFELQNSDIKIIDLANKYGYNSPTAFNRVFQSLQGVSPTVARNKGICLKSYPKMSFLISVKGDINLSYRIEDKQNFTVIGLKERMNTVNGNEDFNRITEMWAKLTEEQASKILSLSNSKINGLIGVSANNNGNEFDYYIATTTDVSNEDNLIKLEIPVSTWAIFGCVGALPNSIIEVWKRIFTEWFPSSGYENSDLPCIEVYSDGDMTSDDYKCELWLPIVKSTLSI